MYLLEVVLRLLVVFDCIVAVCLMSPISNQYRVLLLVMLKKQQQYTLPHSDVSQCRMSEFFTVG
jgi:hypothetical protein